MSGTADRLACLRHPRVRDLAWVMAAPSLVDARHGPWAGRVVNDAWCQTQLRAHFDWLQALDRNPQPLLDWLARRPDRRLGPRFEQLVEYWLQHLPQIRFHGRGIVIGNGERTLGEFDFLFYDEARQKAIHWEVAVKYYLRHGKGGACRWYGPNPRDRWDIKIPHLFERQLQLAQRPEARPVLDNAGWSGVHAEALVRGWLFSPWHEDWRQPEVVPEGAAHGHLRGWWIYHEAGLPETAPSTRWRVLERLEWLAPARETDPARLYSADDMAALLAEHFRKNGQGLLLAEMREGPAAWEEHSRGFVVARPWPQWHRRGRR